MQSLPHRYLFVPTWPCVQAVWVYPVPACSSIIISTVLCCSKGGGRQSIRGLIRGNLFVRGKVRVSITSAYHLESWLFFFWHQIPHLCVAQDKETKVWSSALTPRFFFLLITHSREFFMRAPPFTHARPPSVRWTFHSNVWVNPPLPAP